MKCACWSCLAIMLQTCALCFFKNLCNVENFSVRALGLETNHTVSKKNYLKKKKKAIERCQIFNFKWKIHYWLKEKSSSANSWPMICKIHGGEQCKEQAASIFQLYLMEEPCIAKITRDSVSFFANSSWAKCNPWWVLVKAIKPEQGHLPECL